MKSKKTLLSLVIGALLTAGMASYSMPGYADNDKETVNKKTDNDDKSSHDSEGNSDVSDADDRDGSGGKGPSNNTSRDNSSSKITICHVPPGNPTNKHTIHIAFSAWAAHQGHTNTKGPDYADYLGSCNNTPATGSTANPEPLHVISGCTGTYRSTLATKVHSYFEPITVADTALDDTDGEAVATAMSQCLDKGDSSDSSDSSDSGNGNHDNRTVSSQKGGAHDSVSDSGNHHRIRGCQNKDTRIADSSKKGVSDSDKDPANKNYHKKLKDLDIDHDAKKGYADPVVVSDSSLNDKDVWTVFKACAQNAGDTTKLDASKTGNKKGDSGHKHFVLKTCGTTQDLAIKTAITAYRAKTSTKNIILTQTSYNDASIQAAVDACVKAGATDTLVSGSGSTSSITPVIVLTNATYTGSVVGGTIIAGTLTSGIITGGITVSKGGVITTTGAEVKGKTTGATLTSSGTVTAGTIVAGTSTGGTTTGGTTTGASLADLIITNATITGVGRASGVGASGVSGRLNFRENTSPIKN